MKSLEKIHRTPEEKRIRVEKTKAYLAARIARDPGYVAHLKAYRAAYHLRRKNEELIPRREGREPMYLLKKRCAKKGISVADYESLLAVSDGCAICGVVPEPPTVLRIDHDHKTGRVRGLLCDNCNHGVGKFKDSPERLAAAIEYLGG